MRLERMVRRYASAMLKAGAARASCPACVWEMLNSLGLHAGEIWSSRLGQTKHERARRVAGAKAEG